MESCVDEVVKALESRHELQITGSSRTALEGFLERHLEEYPPDKPYLMIRPSGWRRGLLWREMMADRVLLFLYITGEVPITTDKVSGAKKRIGRNDDGSLKPVEEKLKDLVLLSQKSFGAVPSYKKNRNDDRLRGFYNKIQTYNKWRDLIEEIFQDTIVENYYGQHPSVDRHVSQQGKSRTRDPEKRGLEQSRRDYLNYVKAFLPIARKIGDVGYSIGSIRFYRRSLRVRIQEHEEYVDMDLVVRDFKQALEIAEINPPLNLDFWYSRFPNSSSERMVLRIAPISNGDFIRAKAFLDAYKQVLTEISR